MHPPIYQSWVNAFTVAVDALCKNPSVQDYRERMQVQIDTLVFLHLLLVSALLTIREPLKLVYEQREDGKAGLIWSAIEDAPRFAERLSKEEYEQQKEDFTKKALADLHSLLLNSPLPTVFTN